MKLWRIRLFTTLVLCAFITIFVYSSCERNVCDNVTCFNGGSCNMGECRCPVGYEGTQCAAESRARFLGNYAGLSTCLNDGTIGASTFDTAYVTADPKQVNFVYVSLKSLPHSVLHGYISSNVSTYSVIVASDSTSNYLERYTITLQNNSVLDIHTYLDDETVPATPVLRDCNFLSSRKY